MKSLARRFGLNCDGIPSVFCPPPSLMNPLTKSKDNNIENNAYKLKNKLRDTNECEDEYVYLRA